MYFDDMLNEEIKNLASAASSDLLPEISKERHLKTYQAFQEWKTEKNVNCTSETVLMAYAYVLSAKIKPSSLWAYISMLKSVIRLKEKIDIGEYHELNAFLKRKSEGYEPTKSKTLSKADVDQFIKTADDFAWLDVKAVCVFGVLGACRGNELYNFSIGDVEKHESLYLVNITDTKTKKNRSFVIKCPFYDIAKKYLDLRPPYVQSKRLFINYQKGRCYNQVIGKQKPAKMPSRIAAFLNLENPELYTGHAFRRSSASILANSGASKEKVQNLGDWASAKVADGYVVESLNYKIRTADIISKSVIGTSSASCFSGKSSSSMQCATEPSSSSTKPNGTVNKKRKMENVAVDDVRVDDVPVDYASDVDLVVYSQGYLESTCADDGIEDSVLVAFNMEPVLSPLSMKNARPKQMKDARTKQESEKPGPNSALKELSERQFSFSNCTVHFNFKD